MSARLTVVLDDEDLYRRLKVRAAEEHVSMKDLVEAGLRKVLSEGDATEPAAKPFDWDRYEDLMAQFRAEDEASGAKSEYPIDLSDVKHHLYGYPKASERGSLRVAEEPGKYDR
jgi:plasmid stability protein